MKKFVFIILALVAVVYLFGCAKKQQALEEMQEPISMETLSTLNATIPTAPAVPEVKPQAIQSLPPPPVGLGPLPPTGPYKPTNQEVQTALKSAGYYTGLIDGKIGPMTKKAIEEFQNANGLEVDGKVGPKTWAALSAHLNPQAQAQPKN